MSFNPHDLQHGTYKGKVEVLRGKRAMLRLNLAAKRPARWLAQFDEPDLYLGDRRIDVGWHEFPFDAFDLHLELT